MMMNSLSFCLFGKFLFLSNFWKLSLLVEEDLVDSFFPFSTFNILSYSLFACRAFAEKFVDKTCCHSFVYDVLLISCCCLNFSLSLIFDSLNIICLSVLLLWLYLIGIYVLLVPGYCHFSSDWENF